MTRAQRSEAGFTAVELITALIILAIIVVPLGMSLVQAMKVTTQSGSRSTIASERIFLTDAFARDTANADHVVTPTEISASNPDPTKTQCPTATGTTTVDFYQATWQDGGNVTVTYTATFKSFPASTSSLRRVDITRTEQVGANPPTTKLLLGSPTDSASAFCDSSATDPTIEASNELPAVGQLHRRVHILLRLMARPDLGIEKTDLEGALGKTH